MKYSNNNIKVYGYSNGLFNITIMKQKKRSTDKARNKKVIWYIPSLSQLNV